MNILFDGNYLFWKSWSIVQMYYKDRDLEEVLSDPKERQVLIRKCIIDMCFALNKFHDIKRVAFVIDSHSWRYEFYDDYKYALTRVKENYYKWFIKALDEFETLLRSRGLIVSRIDGAEGDDLLYVWSVYFGYCLNEELVIITGDSDIRQIITRNVSLFNNNSKNLKFYCANGKEVYWNEYLDTDVSVIPVNPFEILLYKVVMGDTSDNIPKLRKGFGQKAFENFCKYIGPFGVPQNVDFVDMARFIAMRFSEFVHCREDEVLDKIMFNLKMTWLNLSVYNSMDYVGENNKGLLENMLDDVNNQKNKYSYNKQYTLEQFYGSLIK